MQATLYDGLTARAHEVEAEIDGDTLLLSDGGRIAFSVLRRGDRVSHRVVLHRTDQRDWRLVLLEPPPAGWLRRMPDVGRLSARARGLYIGAGATVAAIGLGLWLFGEPLLEATAPLIPHRVTLPIGEGVVASLGGKICLAPAGVAALGRLTARLRPPGGFVEPVGVIVLDTAAVNALAAPGGRVVIFRGLIDKAQGADEVAGVLAHELTHVGLRHPTKALLRQVGVGLLIQSLGGNVGSFADMTIVLDSTRRAERAADDGAVKLLRMAKISPAGLAFFFTRLDAEAKAKPRDVAERVVERLGDYAATHPGATERARTVGAAVAQQGPVTPAMSSGDWAALRTICGQR